MRRLPVLIAIAALACTVALPGQTVKPDKRTDNAKTPSVPANPHVRQGNLVKILVEPGLETEARQYYKDIQSAAHLDLPLVDDAGNPLATLDSLMQYTGHQKKGAPVGKEGLKANDLEVAASDVLMDFEKLETYFKGTNRDPADLVRLAADDIIAIRWFAPKITDVAVPDGEANFFGWRKLVRLRPLDGSKAKEKGVGGVFLLFNVFATQEQLNKGSPFENRSGNNQAIVTRAAGGSLPHTTYFMVFGALAPSNALAPVPLKKQVPGQIIYALNASFDFRHYQSVPPNQAYFVPKACAQCHGDEFGLGVGKLNYLDTDHWFDRIAPGDDFNFIAQTSHGVVFDGGKDTGTPAFQSAFAVIRRMNQEIIAQNEIADPSGANFGLTAAKKWAALHETETAHIGLLEDRNKDGFLDRAITGAASTDRWRKNDRIDEAVLPLLNRYCYRCHSSVRYSIYDRSAVRLRSGEQFQRYMQRLVSEPADKVPFMPQDRLLPVVDRRRLVDLLDRMID